MSNDQLNKELHNRIIELAKLDTILDSLNAAHTLLLLVQDAVNSNENIWVNQRKNNNAFHTHMLQKITQLLENKFQIDEKIAQYRRLPNDVLFAQIGVELERFHRSLIVELQTINNIYRTNRDSKQ